MLVAAVGGRRLRGCREEGQQFTLGDLRRAVGRLDQDISALGTECDGHGPPESLDTGQQGGTAFDTELELLCGDECQPNRFSSSKPRRRGCTVPCEQTAAAARRRAAWPS